MSPEGDQVTFLLGNLVVLFSKRLLCRLVGLYTCTANDQVLFKSQAPPPAPNRPLLAGP